MGFVDAVSVCVCWVFLMRNTTVERIINASKNRINFAETAKLNSPPLDTFYNSWRKSTGSVVLVEVTFQRIG